MEKLLIISLIQTVFYLFILHVQSFSFPNPIKMLTTDKNVKALKRESNTPPGDTDGGGDVYVGPPKNRFLEKGLKNDEVLIPCSECMKIVQKYVGTCALYEASLRPLITVREFCESSLGTDPTFTDRDAEYCSHLGLKLATVTGANFAALHTNNHVMGTCAAYQQMCQAHGGPPNCYSGFCDDVAECTDCPFAVLQVAAEAPFVAEVCGDRGVCRLASFKGRTGYCECDDNYRGLSCNELTRIPLKK